MADSLLLRGIELRYVLSINLALHGPATIPTLVETLEYQGFSLAGAALREEAAARRRGDVFWESLGA